MAKTDRKSSSDDDHEDGSSSESEQSSASQSADLESGSKQEQEPKKPQGHPQPPVPFSSEEIDTHSDSKTRSSPKKPVTEAKAKPKLVSSKSKDRIEEPKPTSKSLKKSGSKAAKSKRSRPDATAEGEKPAKKLKREDTTMETRKKVKKARSSGDDGEKDTMAVKKSAEMDGDSEPVQKNGTTDGDPSKRLFQRLWSEDDEVVILQGSVDYMIEKNKNPISDMGAFFEFVKKSLHIDVSKTQLKDKVKKLKRKFVNNSKKNKGAGRKFNNIHEQKCYDLSKLIWGGSSNIGTVSKKNLKGDIDIDVSRFVRFDNNASAVLSEEIVKGGLELVEGAKRHELHARWKKLKIKELQLFVDRANLLKEQATVVLEAINSSEN